MTLRRRVAVPVLACASLLAGCKGRPADRGAVEPTTTVATVGATAPGIAPIPIQPLVPLPPAAEPRSCGPFPPPTAASVRVAEGGGVRWETPAEGGLYSSIGPILDTTTAYTSPAGTVRALDLTSGRERWSVHLGRDVRSLLLHPGIVIATVRTDDDGGALVALARADGTTRWEWRAPPGGAYTPAGSLYGEAVLADGIGLVVGTTAGPLVALDPATGEVRWSVDGPERPRYVVGSGVVVRADDEGPMRGLDGRTGEVRWESDVSLHGRVPVRLGDAMVVEVPSEISQSTRYRALGLADGAVWWDHDTGVQVRFAHASAAGLLVEWSWREWRLLDASTGEVRWQSEVTGAVRSEPLVIGRHLVTLEDPGDSRTQVAARRLSDGIVDWGVVFEGFASEMVRRPAGGVLVTGGGPGPDRKGQVTAVADGQVLWSAIVPDLVTGPAAPLAGGGAVVDVASPLHVCANVGSTATAQAASG